MKNPRKLKRDFKIAASAYNLNPDNWLLLKEGDVYITIIHRVTGTTRSIDKYARPVNAKRKEKKYENGRCNSRRLHGNEEV